jgi:hypothetical protein
VTGSGQVSAKVLEVVDLTIEHNSYATAVGGDGRVAGVQVDHRQAGLAYATGAGFEDTPRVGSTVVEQVELQFHPPASPGGVAYGSRDAAHVVAPMGEADPSGPTIGEQPRRPDS